jgi:transposase InsO family protein
MQATMQVWGKPERVRMDNGSPWGTQSKLPSAFGLWLVGLGVGLTYGRPAHSTDNAVVERDHGVLAQWVEPERCANFQDCQGQLAWATLTQRERYHLPGEPTRLQAYPQLSSNPRRYDPSMDADHWQPQRVCDYLAHFVFQRKVEANGRITLFANPYAVGKQYARQMVEVTLDPQTRQWLVSDEYHRPLRHHPARELAYDQISQLHLAKRRRP